MIKLLTLCLAVFAVLAATNPRQDDHARKLVEHAQQGCAENPLGKLLCGGMAALASPTIDYRDHVVFSTARLGESETLGVLGKVMVIGG
ncbi:MAG TPA: hypothetical protein VLL76_06260 [Candidatus Omnitrophota bacterium]|nr:hypothetical protein [Candidatus Omnitrophota bacterium]